ncbi:MAG: glycosyl transferase [Rhodobacterales bacterium]|nr:MAG: glycosyl transferase [Rhodobacterales bacterium]
MFDNSGATLPAFLRCAEKGGAARPLRAEPLRIFRAPAPHLLAEAKQTPPGPRLVSHRPAAKSPRRKPLGEILVARGDLSPEDLATAVALQAREDARFGDILLANSMTTTKALYAALSEQLNCGLADLKAEPPDCRLIDALGADFCIKNRVLPWKRFGGGTVVIFSRPEDFDTLKAGFPESFGTVRLALAPERELQEALVAARHRSLAILAETRVAEHASCRNWNSAIFGRLMFGMLFALAALFIAAPVWGFALLVGWAVLTLLINSGLKAAAAYKFIQNRSQIKSKPEEIPRGPGFLRLPTVSIMVPLFKEREIAGTLVKRLSALSYPRELLDICLVVEEDDTLTQQTLAHSDLPAWMRQVTVPRGAVRTKPRALNFALDFCRGSIIGVYDAEDAPAPDQIHRVVRRFSERGPEVACLQGVLDFYNARTNWLSRCFTIEYATWFRIVLPGLERLGFAVPLGGTTLFFRRDALEELGGWDAHNVTEDADLGVRLARHGYRTELIDTVTKEEANCRPWPWVKQRSRWIKGYAMTYGVHMRQPRRLLAELGLRKFIGVQILFLGSLSQFLLAPVLWSFWALPLGLPHPLIAVMPSAMFWLLAGVFIASELLTIAVGILSLDAKDRRFLRKWVPTLHFYFPLASLAALKGMLEIATKPFYWDKTQHGKFHHHDKVIWERLRAPVSKERA